MTYLFILDRVLSGTCDKIQAGLKFVAILLSSSQVLEITDVSHYRSYLPFMLHFNPSSGCFPTVPD